MSKVITFSRTFPKGHPRAGQPTYFVEKVLNALLDLKIYTTFDSLLKLNQKSIDDPKSKLTVDHIEKFWYSLNGKKVLASKLHTIRGLSEDKKTGEKYARWKQGDKASLRVWSGAPYNSPQIIIAPEVELVQVGGFHILQDYFDNTWIDIGKKYSYPHPIDLERSTLPTVAKNDGLSTEDFLAWFKYPQPFEGQILCWKEVDYV